MIKYKEQLPEGDWIESWKEWNVYIDGEFVCGSKEQLDALISHLQNIRQMYAAK